MYLSLVVILLGLPVADLDRLLQHENVSSQSLN